MDNWSIFCILKAISSPWWLFPLWFISFLNVIQARIPILRVLSEVIRASLKQSLYSLMSSSILLRFSWKFSSLLAYIEGCDPLRIESCWETVSFSHVWKSRFPSIIWRGPLPNVCIWDSCQKSDGCGCMNLFPGPSLLVYMSGLLQYHTVLLLCICNIICKLGCNSRTDVEETIAVVHTELCTPSLHRPYGAQEHLIKSRKALNNSVISSCFEKPRDT